MCPVSRQLNKARADVTGNEATGKNFTLLYFPSLHILQRKQQDTEEVPLLPLSSAQLKPALTEQGRCYF